MSTKVVKLNRAEQMMTYLEIDKEERRVLVRFADGKEGWVPVDEIEEFSPEKKLELEEIDLPSPYEIEIGTEEGGSIQVPWDFTRHYCDENYETKERNQREEGRSMLGKRIAKIRKAQGMTQEKLAKRANVGRVTVSRIENGEQSPRYHTLEKLARALGVETSRLLGD